MRLTKQVIRNRLVNRSIWVTSSRTALFRTLAGVAQVVPEARVRYVVGIWISGNSVKSLAVVLEKGTESVTTPYSTLWSPIPVGPADFRQIPEGQFDLQDSVATFEGGSQFYGTAVGYEGVSVNVSVAYWDNEI